MSSDFNFKINLPGIVWHLWINQFNITQSGIDFIWNCYRIFFNLEYKSSATGDLILRIVIIIQTLSTLSTMSFHGSPYYQWVCLIEDIFYVVIALTDVIMIFSCHWRKSAPYLLWYGKSVEKSTYSRIERFSLSANGFFKYQLELLGLVFIKYSKKCDFYELRFVSFQMFAACITTTVILEQFEFENTTSILNPKMSLPFVRIV